MKQRHILLIGHEASRTGSVKILLSIARKLTDSYKLTILLLKGGPLFEEFSRCGTVIVTEEIRVSRFQKYRFKWDHLHKDEWKEQTIAAQLSNAEIDLIYANSTPSLPLANRIKAEIQVPLIFHIHELNLVIRQSLVDPVRFFAPVDTFIAPSSIVKVNLVESYNIPSGKIKIIREFIDRQSTQASNAETYSWKIGGSGTVHWRKGIPYFLALGKALADSNLGSKIKLQWLGKVSDFDRLLYQDECIKLGVDNKIEFLGEKSDPESYFCRWDAFVLTSIEDPFPLVCLEALQAGVPVFCWDHGNGITEIADQGGIVPVSFGRVDLMAKGIINLFSSSVTRKTLSEEALKNGKRFAEGNQLEEIKELVTSHLI